MTVVVWAFCFPLIAGATVCASPAGFAEPVLRRMMPVEKCSVGTSAADRSPTADGKTAEPESEESKTRKRAVLQTGLYLIVGIAVVGIALIIVVVLWGIRIRRRRRRPTASKTPFDPLWYLRNSDRQTPPNSEADGDKTP